MMSQRTRLTEECPSISPDDAPQLLLRHACRDSAIIISLCNSVAKSQHQHGKDENMIDDPPERAWQEIVHQVSIIGRSRVMSLDY